MNTSRRDVFRRLFIGRLLDVEMSDVNGHDAPRRDCVRPPSPFDIEKQRIVKASLPMGTVGLQLEEDSPV